MNEQPKENDIYLQLMAISQKTLESGNYETAYHTLTAAMHYAHDIGNEQYLFAVESAAKHQQEWINSHAPQHRMSSQSADERQGIDFYGMLAKQAAMQAALIVRHERHQERIQHFSHPE